MGATYKLKRKTGANTTEEVLFPIASVDGLQTALNGKLGTSAKAADSAKLNGQAASYYLNYTNLTNKPTIPTATSQLTNDSGFLTTETYKGTVTSVKVGTTSYTPSSGVVSLPAYPTVPTKTSQLTNNSDFATNASVDTKIANLVNSAPEALNTLGELATALQTHEDAYDALLTTVGGKVDKVSGKGLSTNDYTTAEKNKLAGIASGAEVNVQSDWSVTDSTSDAFIKNKPSVVYVNQYYTTTNNNYPLLFKALAGNTSTANQLGSTRFVNNIYANPSTGTVYATTFNGALKGNADTATNADKLGNLFANQYATKQDIADLTQLADIRSIDTWANEPQFTSTDEGITWSEQAAMYDGDDNQIWEGWIDHRVPLVAGDNVTFEVQNNQVKVNATGGGGSGGVQKLTSYTNRLTINSTTVGAHFNVFCTIIEPQELMIGSNTITLDSGRNYSATVEGLLSFQQSNGNYVWHIMVTIRDDSNTGSADAYRYVIETASSFSITHSGYSTSSQCIFSGILYE